MKKIITVLNFAGILALAAVSVFQWQNESRLRHRRDELHEQCQNLEAGLDTTQKALASANGTIEEFRKRIATLDADNAALSKELKAERVLNANLAGDVARLEKAVATWRDAVAERDKAIATLQNSLRAETAGRKEAVNRFNDLVGKYNDLAKRVAGAEQALVAARAERDKAELELKALKAVNES